MNDAPARTQTSPAARPLLLLGELAEIGLDIARGIERRIKAAPDPSLAELNTAAVAYARVARAVRQTIMLQSKLLAEQEAARAKAADLRGCARRIVRQAIEDEHQDKERIERLVAEAAERLEQEADGDILIRPIGEIVADICRDLGLDPDWPSLADEISAAEAFARGRAGVAESPPPSGPFEVRWLNEDERFAPSAVSDSS